MRNSIIASILLITSLACNAAIDPLRICGINLIPVSCTNGPATATVTLEVAGGTPHYSYSIDGQEPQVSNKFTGINAGQHIFTIVDQANEELSAVIVTGPSPFTHVQVRQAPYCDDRHNQGIISITTQGGTAPVLQELLETDDQFVGASGQFPPTGPGRYTVVSTPSNQAPCNPTQITFDLILPQASTNELLNFINTKYCVPCID